MNNSPEVFIDGHRYVKEEPEPDRVSIWYMRDNHTFAKIYGTLVDDILSKADAIEKSYPWGMLCSVTLLIGFKELRRVGSEVHSHGLENPGIWIEGKKKWRIDVENDMDIMRLLPFNLEKND